MRILHSCSTPSLVALLALASSLLALRTQARGAPTITGKIVLADGKPVAGATVETSQDCDHGHSIETRKTVSAADGIFSLVAYDPRCSRYRLVASKEKDFWMPSDDLLGSTFGPTINERVVVDVSSNPPPEPVRIVLNSRGGKAAIRVRDLATGRFVYANLWFQKPDQDNILGVLVPTGLNGSASVHLWTPGEYTLQVSSFTCGSSRSEEYVTAEGPKFALIVRPAAEVSEVIDIDSRTIKVLKHDAGKFISTSISPNCNLQSPPTSLRN
jgi:hypothetical protein